MPDVPADATTDADARRRIAAAWREMRRGASGAALRAHLVGPDAPPLEQGQLDALEVLASREEGWRMGDFADAMHVDPSTATRAVARLERLGLAERHPDPDDRRVVLARPTARGRRTIDDMLRRRSHGMERVLEPFSLEEQAQFAEYLERLVASVERLVDELGREAGAALQAQRGHPRR